MSKQITTYKIRQVIELTGASEFLLRAWELRYSALEPVRTKTGRRLYTSEDVLKVRALLKLTQQGQRVGDIAHLSLAELNQMLKHGALSKIEVSIDPSIKKIMTNATEFKWPQVSTLVLQEIQKRKPMNWILNFIVPLLSEIGRQVDAKHLSIAQEHILSAIIKENLEYYHHRKVPIKNGPRIVFATPEGDFHDIGLLIAAHIAAELRAHTLFLGPHMPKSELAAVCVRYKATHLLISSTTGLDVSTKADYLGYINYLDRNLDSNIAIWLAGRNSQKYSLSLSRPFKIIDSFVAFESEVKKCLK